MLSCPSVRLSRLRGGGGGGVYLRNARLSKFSYVFGMELLWGDIHHISKDRFGLLVESL